MWPKTYWYLFIFLFMVDDIFATAKAVESAQKQFSKSVDLTWFIIGGIVVVCGFLIWLFVTAKNISKKRMRK